ncbi:hypothetical protein FE391_43505 [Nonomuraea sp. KC401]|uniref:DUF6283 family protein n=1 Tax=unclassified Nonomuraea TaxID=2593643 RepID=UPI0010FDF207|nr:MULTISPECIES: DUF6283 family protein [unclassified Nonomuraea]NBF00227.1 hypothetical protein [Nonomuraea sp. K271]TLF52460.1 hypothetical protein FE391_43505 [Nonomuraea sp. KC401]
MTMEQDRTGEERSAGRIAASDARAAPSRPGLHQTDGGSRVPLTELFRSGAEREPGQTDPDHRTGPAQPQTSDPGRPPATPLPFRRFPCAPCSLRRDAPLGVFTPEQFEAMRATCRSAGAHATVDASLFGCHPGEPGTGDDLACAGWLAVEGRNSLRVGLAIAFDRLPDTVLDPGPGWPELYGSFEEMVAANRTVHQHVADVAADEPAARERGPRPLPRSTDRGERR